MNSYDLIFFQIDAVCCVVYLIIAFYLVKSRDQNRFLYIAVLFTAIMVVSCDIGTRLSVDTRCSSYFNIYYSYNTLCDKLNGASIVFSIAKYISYFALIFSVSMIAFIKSKNRMESRKFKLFIFSTPLLLAVYLIVSSLFNGKVLILTYNGLLIRGPYFFLLVIIIGFYSVVGLYYSLSIVNAQKERLAEITYYRTEYVIFYVAITMPFILSTIGLLLDYPIVVAVFALGFTYLMTIHQHLRLSLDELTSINNLNELRRYLDNLMLAPEKVRRQTFLIFIDLNKFKQINDQYGHNRGDVVLIQISRILKNVASSFNCFVCRYAGDEFIMIKKYGNEEKAASICKYIDKCLKQLKELSLSPYELSASTGFTRFDRNFKNTQEFIDAADKLMYETKRSTKKDFAEILKQHKTAEIGKDIFKYGRKKI